MSSLRAVLDASVLLPAPLRDTLLCAADKALYRLGWTEDILDELQLDLVRMRHSTHENARRLVGLMKTYFPEAMVEGYTRLVPYMTNGPDEMDRLVLAAAVKSRSQVIVTLNLADFPEEALVPFGIEAQSPDVFLTNLFNLAPEVMTQIVFNQAGELRCPPMTAERVLEVIAAQQAPEFARLVHAALPGAWW